MHNSGLQQKINHFESPQDEDDQLQFERQQIPPKSKIAFRSHAQINKKPNVSFNLGRIIPKNIVHDKEQLYSQNMRLREQITQLKDQNTKMKTQLAFSERQKNDIIDSYGPAQIGLRRESNRSANRHKGPSVSLQSQNFMKKMLKEVRDEADKLKKQNNKIKKTVKYTKIQQLLSQSMQYQQQCCRLTELISNDSYVNSNMHQRIDQLKSELALQKQTSKSLLGQIKRKNEQNQKIRNQSKDRQDALKKMTKQYNALRIERRSDRTYSNLNLRQNIKQGVIGRKSANPEKCHKCEQLEKQINGYKMELIAANKKIIELQKQVKDKFIEEIKIKNQTAKIQNMNKIQNKEITKVSQNKNKQANIQEKKPKIQQNIEQNIKVKQSQIEDNSNQKNEKLVDQSYEDIYVMDDQYEQDYQKQQPKISSKKQQQNLQNQKQYNVAPLKSDNKLQQTNQQVKNQSSNQQNYQQQYEGLDDYQQQYEQQNPQINQNTLLKQTLSYRFYAQRYTLDDLQSDLKSSNLTVISLQALMEMLSCQPFLLNTQLMRDALNYLFEKQQLSDQDHISSKQFISKFRFLIDEKQLLDEEIQKKQLQKIQSIFINEKKQKKIVQSFKRASSEASVINAKDFQNILRIDGKLSDKQILLSIGQACLISQDIEHLQFQAFIERIKDIEIEL